MLQKTDISRPDPHGSVIIAGSVNDEEAKKLFPKGWKAPKSYLRITEQPK